MKKISTFSFACFVTILLYGQKNEIVPNSFLLGNSITIYKSSNGKQIKRILAKPNSDDFYQSDVLFKRDNRFYLKANSIYNDKLVFGWVDCKDVKVGLRSTSNDSIPIYTVPKYAAGKRVVHIHIESVIAEVIAIDKNWLKVCFMNKGKKVIGWLAPENQCCDLYTMCSG